MPDFNVIYDKEKDEFLAVKSNWERTPTTIMGKKVVITGFFRKPIDAIDYAKYLASVGRLSL